MKRKRGERLRTAINAVIAVALMSLLLAALPGLRSVSPTKAPESAAVLIDRTAALDMKKQEVQKRRIPTQIMRSIQTQTRATVDRIANESFKFAPDLGIQGASDVAVPDRRQVRSQVFSEEETDVRPVLAARNPIPYPTEARKKGIEGVADLEILVDESGRVVRVNCNQLPSELFRASVTDAVMRWRFKPAQVKGVAVNVRVRQKITFRLSKSSR